MTTGRSSTPTRKSTGDEAGELKKIAARAPEHDLVFATDEDMLLGNDPLVNAYDLGSDPCRFAKDRITLASQLLKDLDAKAIKDGESWARLRDRLLLPAGPVGQRGRPGRLARRRPVDLPRPQGGQGRPRPDRADRRREAARRAGVPGRAHPQRQGVPVLPRPAPPAVQGALGRWGGRERVRRLTGEVPVNDRVLAIQKIALSHCLSGSVLTRLQNQELQSEPGSKPLADGRGLPVADRRHLLRAERTGLGRRQAPAGHLLDDPPEPPARIPPEARHDRPRPGPLPLRRRLPVTSCSTARRGYPADARALARMHLKEIGEKLGKVLSAKDVRSTTPAGPTSTTWPEDRQGSRRRHQRQRALIGRRATSCRGSGHPDRGVRGFDSPGPKTALIGHRGQSACLHRPRPWTRSERSPVHGQEFERGSGTAELRTAGPRP